MIDIEIPEELQNVKREMSMDGNLMIFENGKIGIVTKNKFKECKVYYGERGYAVVSPYQNGRQKIYSVHRLLATAFIDNPESKPAVNHKDGNKSNNDLSNLEWVTNSENAIHAYANDLINVNRHRVNCSICSRFTRSRKDGICSVCKEKIKAEKKRKEKRMNRINEVKALKVETLTPKQKEVVALAKEGMTVSEISRAIGKTRQAVSLLLIGAKSI